MNDDIKNLCTIYEGTMQEAYFRSTDGGESFTKTTDKNREQSGIMKDTDKKRERGNLRDFDHDEVLRIANESDTTEIWCRFDYSEGNMKVDKDAILFNMGAAKNCPSAQKGMCILYDNNLCYAKNSEVQYHKTALPFRERQERQWKTLTAKQIVALIEAIVISKRKAKIRYMRFNESGDFWDQSDIEKIVEIANRMKSSPILSHMVIYTYTHRKDLDFEPIEALANMMIQGSGYYDDGSVFMLDNNFSAYEYTDMVSMLEGSGELPEKFVVCPGSCHGCMICKTKGKKMISIIMHGVGSHLKTEQGELTRVIKKLIEDSGNNTLPDEYVKRLFLSQHNSEVAFLEQLAKYVKSKRITKEQLNNIFLRRREVDHFMQGVDSSDRSWRPVRVAKESDMISAGVTAATIKRALEFASGGIESEITGDADQFKIADTLKSRYQEESKKISLNACEWPFVLAEDAKKESTENISKLATLALVGQLKNDPRYVSRSQLRKIIADIKTDIGIFLGSVKTVGKKIFKDYMGM